MRKTQSNQDEFIDAREKFKRGVEKRNEGYYENLQSNDISTAIEAAVDLAYNDAKRTLYGIGKHPGEKDQARKCLKDELNTYFTKNDAPSTEKDFDKIHDELCQKWCKEFKSLGKLGTYGKAQKIVNMSFKYLYCRNDADKRKDHFKYCHMPLDSFTLEWFKREYPKQNNGNKLDNIITSWSNLKSGDNNDPDTFIDDDGKKCYSYHFFKEEIRKIANNKGIFPLELEFIVWPQIQKELAAEDFLFGLEENLNKDDKNKIEEKSPKEMSLKEKYNKIVEILNNWINQN